MEKPKSRKELILRLLLAILSLGGLFLLLYLLLHHFGITDLSVEEIREYVARGGSFSFLLFVLISFLQVTFIPIPSTVTVLAGNILFGPWISFFGSLLGTWFGSALAFFLGRRLGRPFANWVVGDRERVDYYLGRTGGREFIVFFFMFLLPGFPDDILCAIAGVTDLRPIQFVFIQATCRPLSIGATLIFMTGELIPYTGWGIALLVSLFLLSILAFFFAYRRADQIRAFFDRLFPPRTEK